METNEVKEGNLCLDINRTNNLLVHGNTLISVTGMCESVLNIHNQAEVDKENPDLWTIEYLQNILKKVNNNPLNSEIIWNTYKCELEKIINKKVTGIFYPGEMTDLEKQVSVDCIILKTEDYKCVAN